MSTLTTDSDAKLHTTPSSKKSTPQWTAKQCRVQNILLLAGCNLAERLEILLTLPGAEFWLQLNNHPIERLRDAIEHWYNSGDRWMEVFEKADTENSDEA